MARRKKLRTATILLGSVLALAIAFSHYLTFESFAPEKVSTEQTDQAGDESRTTITLPTFSLPAPVNVQASLDAYCLFEILLEEDLDENYVRDDVAYVSRLFHTMFRVIISPNAP